jgi:Ca2+-binding RTX toxin-like protein
VKAGGGNDKVYGQDGNDQLFGEAGNDTMYGDAGNDILDGGLGSDFLYADSGNDRLYGGDSNDTINVIGGGSHWVEGGSGNDYIWARTSTAATRVYDGGSGADFFEISTSNYNGTGAGHGINAMGRVILKNFDLSDTWSVRHIHDTLANRGCLKFENWNHYDSTTGQNYKVLNLSGFAGSGHPEYGEIWFPAQFTEQQIASRMLLDFGDYAGKYAVLV